MLAHANCHASRAPQVRHAIIRCGACCYNRRIPPHARHPFGAAIPGRRSEGMEEARARLGRTGLSFRRVISGNFRVALSQVITPELYESIGFSGEVVMAIGVWISLLAYFALMIGIGFYAWRKSTASSEEYLLGGRQLSPAVAALSAGASDMSGWLLLGLPGALYATGLVEAWIGIGLFVGAFVNWIVVAPRLREQTERYDNSLTIPAFLANRFPSRAFALRVVSAVIVVVFFAVYTASGL